MAGTFIVGDVFEYVTGDVTILLVNLTLVSLKKYWLKAESKESSFQEILSAERPMNRAVEES